MPERHQDYASYLLRLWKADKQGRIVWLASLESTLDGERKNFAGLAELLQFLQDRFGELADRSPGNESSIQAGYPTVEKPEDERGSNSFNIR